MVAGQDRYYQIVRCLRDEAAARRPRLRVHAARRRDVLRRRGGRVRGDRAAVRAHPVARSKASRCRRRSRGMTYDEMLDRYGSDKPDLRYGMELGRPGELFAGSGFNAFAQVAGRRRARSRGSRRRAARTSAQREGARQARRGREGPRRRRPRVDRRLRATASRSPVEKFLSPDEMAAVVARPARPTAT